MGLRFQWNRRKAARNLAKHGVSFDEASTVFADGLSVTIFPIQTIPRMRNVGSSSANRIVVGYSVVHTEDDNTVRLISAREADRRERVKYEETRS